MSREVKREKKFGLPKQKEEGSNGFMGFSARIVACLIHATFWSSSSHSQSLAFLQSTCFMSSLQQIVLNFMLSSFHSSPSVSFCAFSTGSICCSGLHPPPPFYRGPFLLFPLILGDLENLTSGFRILCPLFICPWGELTFSPVVTVIKSASF